MRLYNIERVIGFFKISKKKEQKRSDKQDSRRQGAKNKIEARKFDFTYICPCFRWPKIRFYIFCPLFSSPPPLLHMHLVALGLEMRPFCRAAKPFCYVVGILHTDDFFSISFSNRIEPMISFKYDQLGELLCDLGDLEMLFTQLLYIWPPHNSYLSLSVGLSLCLSLSVSLRLSHRICLHTQSIDPLFEEARNCFPVQ